MTSYGRRIVLFFLDLSAEITSAFVYILGLAVLFMGVSGLNRERVRLRWARVHAKEQKYISEHSGLNLPLKARIHAYLCGDGSVSWRKERNTEKIHADIRFYPDHKSLIAPFNGALSEIYGRAAKVKKMRNFYKLSFTSMTVAQDLLKDGPYSSTLWAIPDLKTGLAQENG